MGKMGRPKKQRVKIGSDMTSLPESGIVEARLSDKPESAGGLSDSDKTILSEAEAEFSPPVPSSLPSASPASAPMPSEAEVKAKRRAELVPLVAVLVPVPFVLASRLLANDNWLLTQPEVDSLSPATAAILDKYLPDFFTKYAEEIAFISVLGVIILSRIKPKDKSEKKSG